MGVHGSATALIVMYAFQKLFQKPDFVVIIAIRVHDSCVR